MAPTSMVVSVREGRNVSLVCRVRADPAASISWRYNGLLVDSGLHPRLVRSDQFQGSLGTRSCGRVRRCNCTMVRAWCERRAPHFFVGGVGV